MTGFCLTRLRWTPHEMWRTTPREIALALNHLSPRSSAGPPNRTDLAALMAAFPDRRG